MKEVTLLQAADRAAAMLDVIYQWVDRVEAAGGPTCISGIATCNSMITSLRKNRARTEELIMKPLHRAIAEAKEHQR